MPTQGVWSDEYTGPRYTYYSPLRPISPTLLPDGYTVVISVGSDPRRITTTEALPERFIQNWSLELQQKED